MSYLEARRTHDLFDEKGKEVGWLYEADTGEPLVYLFDKKRAEKNVRLKVQPATDSHALCSSDRK